MKGERALTRRSIGVRHPERGLVTVTGHEAGGIAIVPWSESCLAESDATRALQESLGKTPRVETRDGFILVDTAKQIPMTPAGWLMPDFDSAKRLLAEILDTHAGNLAERHRAHGAWTGRKHYLRELDAAIDQTVFEAKLAELKAQPDSEHWLRHHEGAGFR